MTRLSDMGVVQDVQRNPYMQAFYGFEKFVTVEILDPSTQTKMRERLGLGFFKELETKTYKLLIDRKIIKAKGMLVDAIQQIKAQGKRIKAHNTERLRVAENIFHQH